MMILNKLTGATNIKFICALKPALHLSYRKISLLTLSFFCILFFFSCASRQKITLPKNLSFKINGLPSNLYNSNTYFPVVYINYPPKKMQVSFNDKKLLLVSEKKNKFLYVLPIPNNIKEGTYKLTLSATFENKLKAQNVSEYNVIIKDRGEEKLWVDPKKVNYTAAVKRRIKREALDIKFFVEEVNNPRFWTNFNCPLNICQITSPYGIKRTFNDQARGYHGGVDLRAAYSTPVKSPAPGRILLTKELFLCGNAVLMDHGLGVYSLFCHLSKIVATKGTIIDKGVNIGYVGSTGRSTGPHLHWALFVDNTKVDPINFMFNVNSVKF